MTDTMFPELRAAALDDLRVDPDTIPLAQAAAWTYARRVMLVWYQAQRAAALDAGDMKSVMHYDGLITQLEVIR